MVGVKICWIQGDLLVCRGLNFPEGFGFRTRKRPLLALDSTNFPNFSPAARHGQAILGILPYFNSQFSKNSLAAGCLHFQRIIW